MVEVDCTDRHGGQSEIPGLLPTADGNQRQIRDSERKGKIITIYNEVCNLYKNTKTQFT